MWQHCALKEDQLRSAVRFSLPALSASKSLLANRPQSERTHVLRLNEIVCTLGYDISQIPSLTRNTTRHFSSRHREVSQWQALVSDSIDRVEEEITAVEQAKDLVDCCLQERHLYSQLTSDCAALSNGLCLAVLRQDRVLTQLRREEQLTSDIRELLQKQNCILLYKLSSLKNIHAQLLSELHNKGEAVKLTTKCITHEPHSLSSALLPAGQYKPSHVSYDTWLTHSKDLRLAAENLIKDSSSFRGNLRLTMANLRNAQQHQRRCTHDSMRKRINDVLRVQDTLIWERQQIKDEISDLTKNTEKVSAQIRNCEVKMNQATQRLDILNRRPRYELCLDGPHISLTLEKDDLAKMITGLCSVLKHYQLNLDLARSRLMTQEDKLAKNAHILEVAHKCQKLHHNFVPAYDTTVVLPKKHTL
ncbi:tektin-2-like [Embiotoca jacksoni]|uniref:tektin-2-like n=1 Tax=Embiotoca jacksoni TaxID=100190 RepID=UPI0037047815